MRFVKLAMELRQAGVLDLVADPRKEAAFDVVIEKASHRYSRKVREVLDLLDLRMPTDESTQIVIPAYFAITPKGTWGIGITTRSTMDLTEILRAAIDVPKEHARAGLTVDYPPMGLPGQGIRIISSRLRPGRVSLAVKYRGYWFYIDEADQATKAFFKVLRAFWSVSMSTSADQRVAPVLTIPVSQ